MPRQARPMGEMPVQPLGGGAGLGEPTGMRAQLPAGMPGMGMQRPAYAPLNFDAMRQRFQGMQGMQPLQGMPPQVAQGAIPQQGAPTVDPAQIQNGLQGVQQGPTQGGQQFDPRMLAQALMAQRGNLQG